MIFKTIITKLFFLMIIFHTANYNVANYLF